MIQLSKNTKLICGGVVLCLLTIVPAVLHGSLLNRWGTGKQLDEAGQSINGLPTQLGKWIQVGEDDVLSKDVLKELAINEYASRVYSDPQSGEQVRLLLMSGQPGPLVLHPPDICYAMTGRQLIQKTPKCSISAGGQQHYFQVLRYRDGGALAGEFYVVYGFFDGSE